MRERNNLMKPTLPGLHHVTAITADGQKNLDFYCNVLGLRLVKLTVNFDDPGSYHLYYGDGQGSPGTIMTFFTSPGAYPGRSGSGQVVATAFAAPKGALEHWRDRLQRSGLQPQPKQRLGQQLLTFSDPDGLALEIVEDGSPGDLALRGFHSVTLGLERHQPSADLLTRVLGFKAEGHEDGRYRFRAQGGDGFASVVDLLAGAERPGTMGSGSIHHVAWRTADDPQQAQWRSKLIGLGQAVSPIMDRNYFHSIYFREPGGVLFEIATDPPGFTVDQSLEELGTWLVLPAWLEPRRAQLLEILPRLQLPTAVSHPR